MRMPGHPIRVINQLTHVHPAWMIPRLGFGTTDITTSMAPQGLCLFTAQMPRAFHLICGCIIHHECEAASPCHDCLDELLASDEPPALSIEELSWAVTPCRWECHFRSCQYQFCGKAGCSRHFAVAPDGGSYCRSHFNEVVNNLEMADLREQRGPLLAWLARSYRSLFFR